MPSLFCLILEDEPFIAMELADAFEEAGYALLGPFATCARALSALETQTPSIAIVDLHVNDGSCLPVFAKLRSLGVPIIVYSGQNAEYHPDFLEAVWLNKPSTSATIVQAAKQLQAGP